MKSAKNGEILCDSLKNCWGWGQVSEGLFRTNFRDARSRIPFLKDGILKHLNEISEHYKTLQCH